MEKYFYVTPVCNHFSSLLLFSLLMTSCGGVHLVARQDGIYESGQSNALPDDMPREVQTVKRKEPVGYFSQRSQQYVAQFDTNIDDVTEESINEDYRSQTTQANTMVNQNIEPVHTTVIVCDNSWNNRWGGYYNPFWDWRYRRGVVYDPYYNNWSWGWNRFGDPYYNNWAWRNRWYGNSWNWGWRDNWAWNNRFNYWGNSYYTPNTVYRRSSLRTPSRVYARIATTRAARTYASSSRTSTRVYNGRSRASGLYTSSARPKRTSVRSSSRQTRRTTRPVFSKEKARRVYRGR